MKSKLYVLIIFLSILFIQKIKTQNYFDIGDSLELNIQNYKYGVIQWQFSSDSLTWNNLNLAPDTLIKTRIDRSGFYRAQVNYCSDSYNSDIYQVDAPYSDADFIDFVGKYLASDQYGGRYPGTKGDTLSDTLISNLFQYFDLKPLNSSSYIKPFLTKTNITTFNVIGMIHGTDPILSKEVIIISGHYDHLGTVKGNTVMNGADDNASGAAGVCVLARKFRNSNLKRTVLFITPGLEESGQQGTMAFINSKEVPMSTIKYVFNFDMIGRLRSDSVFFCSTSYSPDLIPKILAQNTENLNIKFLNSGLFSGSTSDNAIYTAFKGSNNLSAFGITTGKEPEYHTYKDDWNLINVPGIVKITDLIYRIVVNLANE